MRQVISQRLWIGNARDEHNVSEVLRTGVKAIVDLAMEEAPIRFPRDMLYARLPLLDGTGNSPAVLRAAVHLTATLIAEHVPTLVACGGGLSRSPAIVAAALAVVRKAPLDETLRSLALDRPHDVSPGLWAEIHDAFAEIKQEETQR
jgi:protein-tyrosine phosphatase